MRIRSKFILTVLAATVLLSLAAATGSTRKFRFGQRAFSVIWDPNISASKQALSWTDNVGNTIRCRVTMEGSFHSSSIHKVTAARIGDIYDATFQGCTGGTVTVLRETLPWEIQYAGFTGMLPAITSVITNILRMSIKLELGLRVPCLTRTEAARPFVAILDRWRGTTGPENVRADETRSIDLGAECSLVSPARFSGSSLIRNDVIGGQTTLTLI